MWLSKFIAVQVVAVVLLLELALRVYQPVVSRVRGDDIVLPVKQTYRFANAGARKLDAETVHTKNSLGFRGPEPPRDFDRRVTILTIGGSTTECVFLSDGRTWPDALARRLEPLVPGVWVNNAGIDGHSTFGHLILLRSYVARVHPKVAILLVGVNDVGLRESNTFDVGVLGAGGRIHAVSKALVAHSEVANLALNLVRAARARDRGFGHSEIDLGRVEHLVLDDRVIDGTIEEYKTYLAGYERRLGEIAELTQSQGIEPVWLTQPALYGDVVDPSTGVDVRYAKVNGRGNGHLEWQLLELYNDVTRKVAASRGILLIDLEREMPKDSRYFYDFLHFTNEGADKVAELVAVVLGPHLQSRFARHAGR